MFPNRNKNMTKIIIRSDNDDAKERFEKGTVQTICTTDNEKNKVDARSREGIQKKHKG